MSTTKGNALIAYDINHSHVAVKKSMIDKGYSDHWNYSGQSTVYYLPNTTLWKSNTSSDEAVVDLKATCKTLNVTLEKVIAVLATDWVGA